MLYSKFISVLTSAADSSIPLKNSSLNKIPSPAWWDSECSSAIKERKQAEHNFAESLTVENFVVFQKTAARTKRFLRKKKMDGWRYFCESLAPRTPTNLIWKKIKGFRKSQVDNNINSNDSTLWLPTFFSKLAPPFVPHEACLPTTPSTPSSDSDSMNSIFTFAELSCVLDHVHDSTPGVDGIPYSFITKSSKATKLYFLDLINNFFATGRVPDTWKTQLIVPILKPGKPPLDHNSYRPIALSSVLCKIMEHLLKNRLEWMVENRGLIARSQYGFRKGMGTIDSLSLLTSDIRLAFSKNEHVVGAFLDITAAYDNVDLPLLRQKLQKLSIPERIITIICNMFMERSISIRSSVCPLSPRFVWKGLPQGSVLSPLLYSIYTADLETSVNCFCKILQYADDIALYVTSDSFTDCCSRLNSALFYLNNWLADHGLEISASKSSVVIFSRKRSVPSLDISVNNHTISVKDNVKFLGLYLDSKLSGVNHLNYISNKVEKNINILRALSGAKWGSHPYNQKLLYNAIIRSHFDYGSVLLEPCSKVALAKFDRLQAKCLRIITGSMKSSPTRALQVECLEPPLSLRRQLLADRFFCRAVQIVSHPLLDSLRDLNDQTFISPYWNHKSLPLLVKSFQKIKSIPFSLFQNFRHPLFETTFDSLIFVPNIILNFGIDKNSTAANQRFNQIFQEKWSDWLPIFTDASKLSSNSPVGAAVWIPRFKIVLNFKLPFYNSVYSGESIALLEAALFIESHQIKKSIIFTDCLSCLQDLQKSPFHSRQNSPLTLQIKKILYQCHIVGLEVALAWIPGHCGILGNETADNCAKQAASLGVDKYDKCFPRDLSALSAPEMREQWNQQWQQSFQTVGRYYVTPYNIIYLPV
ncbi:hypothetical protein K1T71_012588 [Dendrolimus kikuchii]|uniref:Uncharacterized protein n=1 Tax=Dendrolimus kikuchii TaxID=765133 RepID=A0ACC1CJQ7_9NEOP|nr:hypothetical protein K1T71_012588 [Dendrolimus kikuchii]